MALVTVHNGKKAGNEALVYERVKSHWELQASIAALVSGFAFIVVTGSADFKYTHFWGTNISRVELYGFITFATFSLATTSLILSALLLTNFKVAGEENVEEYLTHCIETRIFYLPEGLLIYSIIFMLISAIIAMGGFYSWITFVLDVTILCLLMIFMINKWINIRKFTTKLIQEQKSKSVQI